jgi:hypothetical protein
VRVPFENDIGLRVFAGRFIFRVSSTSTDFR